MDHSVAELIKYVIGLITVVMFCIVSRFCIKLLDINPFQQTVNYTIEREGGLTPSAISRINKESKDNYNSSFTITSSDSNKEKKFGELTSYTINQNFSFYFFKKIEFSISRNGESVSQVRTFN